MFPKPVFLPNYINSYFRFPPPLSLNFLCHCLFHICLSETKVEDISINCMVLATSPQWPPLQRTPEALATEDLNAPAITTEDPQRGRHCSMPLSRRICCYTALGSGPEPPPPALHIPGTQNMATLLCLGSRPHLHGFSASTLHNLTSAVGGGVPLWPQTQEPGLALQAINRFFSRSFAG